MDYGCWYGKMVAARRAAGPRADPFLRLPTGSTRNAEIWLRPGDKDEPLDFLAPLHVGGKLRQASHVAIMADLYTKVAVNGVKPRDLLHLLADLYPSASSKGPGSIPSNLVGYKQGTAPSTAVKAAMARAVQGTKHKYNPSDNVDDLEVPELFHLMFWILLQEEVNYGLFNTLRGPLGKRGQGRCLPLDRYAEAIYAGRKKDLTLLEKYANLACNKGRQAPQRDEDVTYAFPPQVAGPYGIP
ncbi:MAG: hypothetical protein AABY18_01205 [Candidatus Thermoplasmatota archaeon]